MKKNKSKKSRDQEAKSVFKIHELFSDISGNPRIVMQNGYGIIRELTDNEKEMFEFAFARGVQLGRGEIIGALSTISEKLYSQDISANFIFN